MACLSTIVSILKNKVMKTICFVIGFLLAINSNMMAQKQLIIKKDSLFVNGNCIQCKERIENTLHEKGIIKAEWNVHSKILYVNYYPEKVSLNQIAAQLAAVGHDTKLIKATEAAYNKLPDCCKYDREEIGSALLNAIDSAAIHSEKVTAERQTILGMVVEENKKGDFISIPNVSLQILGTNTGTVTDSLGVFRLSTTSFPFKAVVSSIGFISDTITINNTKDIKVILRNDATKTLKEVVVNSGRQFSAYVNTVSTLNTLQIGSKEILKAACCNLSESFETTPSIDVSYSDAVTGVKQIQLLGLSGNYSQITTENIPEIKGLSGPYGLTFIPGPWLESVQVTKGAGSVVNGYESIAGQINVEEKKPDQSEKVLVNAYANMLGRMEASANFSHKVNKQWATTLLTHVNNTSVKTDANNDGFLDMPIGKQVNIYNRWRYASDNGIRAQFGIKAMDDNRQAGEIDFSPSLHKLSNTKYGVGFHNQAYQVLGKLGYVYPGKKYKSVGLMISYKTQQNNAYYGQNGYDGKQQSFYANFIYQSIIGTTAHKFRTGISFSNDVYSETFAKNAFNRKEVVPGAFIEYTFNPIDKFTAIFGGRIDYHNQFGWIATPRLHLKYDIAPTTALRLSAGSGFRTANIFAENMGLFVSNRQYAIMNPSNNFGYGLSPEKAWNYGVSITHKYELFSRKGNVTVDFYRTDFVNQTVADVDASPQQLLFYNLDGKSYANSLQFETNYHLLSGLDIRLAYRWLDVKTTYHGVLEEKPLTAIHRAFINLAYETKSHFKFDCTTQWFSSKRLPNTLQNPVAYQMPDRSPAYFQMSAQISKHWRTHWETYIGAENLLNYKQEQLFIDNAHPFSNYFDGSMVWGPVNGRMIYVGMRYQLK